MVKWRFTVGLGMMVYLLATQVLAQAAADPYQVMIPVATQSPLDQEEAVQQGLLQVLIRLTGNANIEKNRAIKKGLARAEYYVQEIYYGTPSTTAYQYPLYIRFDGPDVNHLLNQALHHLDRDEYLQAEKKLRIIKVVR